MLYYGIKSSELDSSSKTDTKSDLDTKEDLIFKSNKAKFLQSLFDYSLSFSTFLSKNSFSSTILKNIESVFGFENPTRFQTEALPKLLTTKGILSIAPMGSGKTLSYCIAIIDIINSMKISKNVSNSNILAIVLVPNTCMAYYVCKQLRSLANNTGISISTEPSNQSNVLVICPEKLGELKKLKKIKFLIFDGFNTTKEINKFQKDHLLELSSIFENNKKACFWLFSNRNFLELKKIASKIIECYETIQLSTEVDISSTVKQNLVFTGSEFGKLVEMRKMIDKEFKADTKYPMLVIVDSEYRADELKSMISDNNSKIEALSRNQSYQEFESIINDFQMNKIEILISPQCFSQAVYFSALKSIVNFDIPIDENDYSLRLAMLVNNLSADQTSVTFFTKNDIQYVSQISALVEKSGKLLPDFLKNSNRKIAKKKQKKTEKKKKKVLCNSRYS